MAPRHYLQGGGDALSDGQVDEKGQDILGTYFIGRAFDPLGITNLFEKCVGVGKGLGDC